MPLLPETFDVESRVWVFGRRGRQEIVSSRLDTQCTTITADRRPLCTVFDGPDAVGGARRPAARQCTGRVTRRVLQFGPAPAGWVTGWWRRESIAVRLATREVFRINAQGHARPNPAGTRRRCRRRAERRGRSPNRPALSSRVTGRSLPRAAEARCCCPRRSPPVATEVVECETESPAVDDPEPGYWLLAIIAGYGMLRPRTSQCSLCAVTKRCCPTRTGPGYRGCWRFRSRAGSSGTRPVAPGGRRRYGRGAGACAVDGAADGRESLVMVDPVISWRFPTAGIGIHSRTCRLAGACAGVVVLPSARDSVQSIVRASCKPPRPRRRAPNGFD